MSLAAVRDLRVGRGAPVTPDDLIALETDVLAGFVLARAAPLHLAAVFGLDPKTAIRYAENAAQLLQATAEEQDPAGSREPKGLNHP